MIDRISTRLPSRSPEEACETDLETMLRARQDELRGRSQSWLRDEFPDAWGLFWYEHGDLVRAVAYVTVLFAAFFAAAVWFLT